ncbi:MAG: hypothetical protein OXC71_08980 [Chloroflexi bacterium]|nr:hypothetical protein [Chloroflexota bacterium]
MTLKAPGLMNGQALQAGTMEVLSMMSSVGAAGRAGATGARAAHGLGGAGLAAGAGAFGGVRGYRASRAAALLARGTGSSPAPVSRALRPPGEGGAPSDVVGATGAGIGSGTPGEDRTPGASEAGFLNADSDAPKPIADLELSADAVAEHDGRGGAGLIPGTEKVAGPSAGIGRGYGKRYTGRFGMFAQRWEARWRASGAAAPGRGGTTSSRSNSDRGPTRPWVASGGRITLQRHRARGRARGASVSSGVTRGHATPRVTPRT